MSSFVIAALSYQNHCHHVMVVTILLHLLLRYCYYINVFIGVTIDITATTILSLRLLSCLTSSLSLLSSFYHYYHYINIVIYH